MQSVVNVSVAVFWGKRCYGQDSLYYRKPAYGSCIGWKNHWEGMGLGAFKGWDFSRGQDRIADAGRIRCDEGISIDSRDELFLFLQSFSEALQRGYPSSRKTI